MKLKMLVGMAGADYSLSPGEETERFSGKEAARLIDAAYAVPVVDQKIERAVKKNADVEQRKAD
jgi:F-type H+-transporting ATPase subunit b